MQRSRLISRHAVLAVALILLTLAAQTRAQEPKKGRTFALLVGVSEYPKLKERHGDKVYRARIRLNGPENDVNLMRRSLVDRQGVPEKNVAVLAGWPGDASQRPTRANILAHFDRLANVATKGDRVVIAMSGHGSQQPDTDGDEADGMDEIFLPADVTDWDQKRGSVTNAITDDEFREHIRRIRDTGATVWVIMDCCHSGTMLRGAGDSSERMRLLDSGLLGVPEQEIRSRGGGQEDGSLGGGGFDMTGIVAMYAAQSYRGAPEMELPKGGKAGAKPHGLFTFMIARQLERAGAGLTFRELYESVLASYQALPYHNTVPLAEGDLDLHVWGGGRDRAPLLVRKQDGELVLNAGSLRGIVPGTVLHLYQPGKAGDESALLGAVTVTETELLRSFCAPAPGITTSKLPRVSPAKSVRVPVSDHALRIALVDSEGHTLAKSALPEACRAAFGDDNAKRFPLVDKPADAHWLLVIDGDSMALEPANMSLGGGVRFKVTAKRLENTLGQIFRVDNLKRLAAGDVVNRLPSGLKFEVFRQAADGSQTLLRAGERLRPGERMLIRLRNESGKIYDVTVLLIDAAYGVTPLFPTAGKTSRLTAKDTKAIDIGPFTVNDKTQGIEHLLVLAVPSDESSAPVDLTMLSAPQLRMRGAAGGTTVERMLRELCAGTTMRGLESSPSAVTLGLFTWRTEWGPIAVGAKFKPDAALVLNNATLMEMLTRTDRKAWSLTSDTTRMRGDLSAFYAKFATAAVVVRTRTGHGTGFFLGNGLVITNHHVAGTGFGFDRKGRPIAWVHRGALDEDGVMRVNKEAAVAVIIAADRAKDLILLKLQVPESWFAGMHAVELASPGPRPGETCIMIGHPASAMLWSVREGNISSIGRMPHDIVDQTVMRLAVKGTANEARFVEQLSRVSPVKIALSSCDGGPGDSGGPLFNAEGKLVGVTFAIPREARKDKFVYHIHVDELRKFLKERPAPNLSGGGAKPKSESKPPKPKDGDDPYGDKEWQRKNFPGQPWGTGSRAALRKTSAKSRTFDLLLSGHDRPTRIFIDVDEDTAPQDDSAETVRRLIRDRSFDAEVVIHTQPDRRIVWYDTDNDGRFDLVLIDMDKDGTADVRFQLHDGKFKAEHDVKVPVLSSGYLKSRRMQQRVMAKFKMLTRTN